VKVLQIRYGNYAERLRALGMDQQDVARKIGVSNQHWSLIVLGKSRNPYAVTAREAAAALGMEFDDLWEVVEVPDPPVAPKDVAAGLVSNAALVAA
jgi:transcriptional regulator with XRE-family HTH domain